MMQYHQFRYDGPMLVEHRQPWMDAVTENKFLVWDDIVRRNLMEKGTPIEKAQVLQLLFDPTIYAYAFFKDANGNPIRLYSYQDMAVNDPNDRIVMVCSNQNGKSFLLRIKAIVYALHHPGKTVVMVSLTKDQSKDLLRGIRDILNSSAVEYKTDVADTDTKTEIYFKHYDVLPNGAQIELQPSRIICVPNTGSALGYPVDLMLIDEEDAFEDGERFYKMIAQPRTYKTEGQIMCFSNPWNGEEGILHQHWMSKRFSKYRMSYLDVPGNTKEKYDALCAELSQAEIDATLDATFATSKGMFLSKQERDAIQEQRPNQLPTTPERPFFVFFDFAKVEDQTVRGVAELLPGGAIYVHELKAYPNRTPYSAVVDDLHQLIEHYGVGNFQAVGWDNTGVGAGIEDFINKIQLLGIPCLPVQFSLENKSRMYTVFKTLAERSLRYDEQGNRKKMLSIPFIPQCDRQLATLRFERSGVHMKVHHLRESDHDDFCDVIAGICGIMVHKNYVPADVEFIQTGTKRHSPYERVCPKCSNPLDDDQKECPVCNEKAEEDWSGIV